METVFPTVFGLEGAKRLERQRGRGQIPFTWPHHQAAPVPAQLVDLVLTARPSPGARATHKFEDEEQVREGDEDREAAGEGAAP